MLNAAFFELFGHLPRGGPGSDRSTREALRRVRPLPAAPRVLDIGCGPGRQTLVLARELGVVVNAVDLFPIFTERLERAAREAGLAERVAVRQGDMGALDDPPGSYDLVWSEGAIFVLGFEEGLRRWAPLLAPEGTLAVTEAVWVQEAPPAEVREFWRAEYPAIASIPETLAMAGAQGFEVYDHFALPRSDWVDEYYAPMRERIAELEPRAAGDPELREVLANARREIDVHDRFGNTYSYAFLLMRRTRS